MVLKIKDKEFNIKYGLEATASSDIFPKMIKIESALSENEDSILNKMSEFALVIAEVMLIGLQCKEHRKEFGYDYDTLDGKKEKLSIVCDLIDEYLDEDEDRNIFDLYNLLTKEMMRNGFIRSLFEKLKEAADKEQTTKKSTKKKLEIVAEEN